MGTEHRDLDAVTGQVATRLLADSHLVPPGSIGAAVATAARPLGVTSAWVYLSDLQRRYLRPSPADGPDGREPLSIETTLAGVAYRTTTLQHSPAEPAGHRAWVPLISGTERLGVLELECDEVSEPLLDRFRTLAALAALLIAGKAGSSDALALTRRTSDMALQAELVWAVLPPVSFATDRFLLTAMLEPAYEVGGDAFDYALTGNRLQLTILDGAGHDLAAGLVASVTLAACRSVRRSGGTLADMAERADRAIATQFGGYRFATALLCELDVATGLLRWIPCGHPPPLLIRDFRVVRELARPPRLPLGLAMLDRDGGEPETEQLEPGDRVLLYTDGVTEGRAQDSTPFGLRRLGDIVIRHSSAGLPAPETMRRLSHEVSDYSRGRLTDDATIVMVEWQPGEPGRQLVP